MTFCPIKGVPPPLPSGGYRGKGGGGGGGPPLRPDDE